MTALAACPGCSAAPLARQIALPTEAPRIHLALPTIHCAACIAKVERTLAAMPGVTGARVHLGQKRVAVSADAAVSSADMVNALSGAGFEAHLLDADILDQTRDTAAQELLTRMAVAGFAMMNVMLLSVAVWSGAENATRDLFHLISAAISLPAVIFAGQPFFATAWRAVRVGTLNMDVPISLAILLAAGMSLYEVLHGGQHAYFDAALSLTFFLLIGRYLDHRTRSAMRSAANDLSALESHTAQRVIEGRVVDVKLADLRIGDVVQVATGMRVPVDGRLMNANGLTDRSFLTGEAEPFALTSGQLVQAGEVNIGAPFRLTATAVGENSTLRRVTALVEAAENSRNSYTLLADRAARIYAPAVHLLALFAFVGWLWFSGDARLSLNIAVAVLIITCPCALGLAVPAVATAAIGRLYSKGFLAKSGAALERLAEVDTVVFDKTGTLTLPGADAATSLLSGEARGIARALAEASEHPVSRAVAVALDDVQPANLADITEVPGQGVEATWQGKTVRLGKATWIGGGASGFGLRIGDAAAHIIPISEKLRPGAVEAVRVLSASGLKVIIMTGDNASVARAVADQIGVSEVLAEHNAEQKFAVLRQMADQGHRVLMVGDGLNDAAALAAAHASIAPSSALDASRNAADVILLRPGLEGVPSAIKVAKSASLLSRQNFAIAAGYNLIAVPIALLGGATPLLAALAMSTSSLTVLLNAMRVRSAG